MTAKQTPRPIPYTKIAQLVKQGETMEEIARATKRFNENSDDPTHGIRAIISTMRTKGFQVSGKVSKLR